jgi:hypothetical protein
LVVSAAVLAAATRGTVAKAAKPNMAQRITAPCLLLFFFVFVAHSIVLVVIALLIDWRQLQRVTRYNFEVGPALLALNDLALFHIIDVDIEWVIALGAYD